jgi:hypothetical protein
MRAVIILLLLMASLFNVTYQPVMDQVNEAKDMYLQNTVQTALQEAAVKGYFTPVDLSTLQSDVANGLGYPVSEVFVQGTTLLTPRGEPLSLKISIPTQLTFLNLGGGDNHMELTAQATAMSEALTP